LKARENKRFEKAHSTTHWQTKISDKCR